MSSDNKIKKLAESIKRVNESDKYDPETDDMNVAQEVAEGIEAIMDCEAKYKSFMRALADTHQKFTDINYVDDDFSDVVKLLDQVYDIIPDPTKVTSRIRAAEIEAKDQREKLETKD